MNKIRRYLKLVVQKSVEHFSKTFIPIYGYGPILHLSIIKKFTFCLFSSTVKKIFNAFHNFTMNVLRPTLLLNIEISSFYILLIYVKLENIHTKEYINLREYQYKGLEVQTLENEITVLQLY